MTHRPERRAEKRDECKITAKIELVDHLAAVTVALTDISPSGVRLRVTDDIDLPDEFDLLIPLLGDLEQRCRVKAVWRGDGAVGGVFLSIGELAAGADDLPRPVGPATDAVDAMDAATAKDRAGRGKRLASVKETGEEVPQAEWERFEAADKKPGK